MYFKIILQNNEYISRINFNIRWISTKITDIFCYFIETWIFSSETISNKISDLSKKAINQSIELIIVNKIIIEFRIKNIDQIPFFFIKFLLNNSNFKIIL